VLADASKAAAVAGVTDRSEQQRLDDLAHGFLHYGSDGKDREHEVDLGVPRDPSLKSGQVSSLAGASHGGARMPPLVRRSATHVADGRSSSKKVLEVGGRAAGAVKQGAAGFFVFRKQPAAPPGMAVVSVGNSPQMSSARGGTGLATALTPLLSSSP